MGYVLYCVCVRKSVSIVCIWVNMYWQLVFVFSLFVMCNNKLTTPSSVCQFDRLFYLILEHSIVPMEMNSIFLLIHIVFF